MNDTTSRNEANTTTGPSARRALTALVLAFGLAVVAGAPARAEIPHEVVMRVKRSVVQIEAANSVALDREVTGSVVGTGFVLDAERGIVATNRHVVGTSPALLRVTFHDGESTTARLLHYDAWHDFALIELERDADARWTASAAELGDSFALRDQQELFLVGSNEGQEQSVKFGRVTSLVVNKGKRHSAAIQTSFDRTGGSSGSPVFDADGRVVAMHTSGTNTTSFELRIEYVRDALKQLLGSGRVRRGEVGLELDLIPVAEARRAARLPDEVAERIAAASGERKQAVQVAYVLAGSPAAGRIRPGDLLVEVDGELVAGDLYGVDRAFDARVGGSAHVVVYRHGARVEHDLPVADAERGKVLRFVLFAGGVFHELTPELRRCIDFAGPGVFLSSAAAGTSMGDLGDNLYEDYPDSRFTVVEEVDGTPTPDLGSFLVVARRLQDGDEVQVILRDFTSTPKSEVRRVTLDLSFEPLRAYRLDRAARTWAEEPAAETAAAVAGGVAGGATSAGAPGQGSER
jgi:S1-C subfamily serine protease